MQKNDLRVRLREERKAVQPAVRAEKSKKIAEVLFKLKEVTDAKSILFYVSCRDEVETHELIKKSLLKGKEVFVPKVDGNTLSVFRIRDLNELKAGAYGILEPVSGKPVSIKRFDVILVPAIGFDKNCNRIGQGKGFYDKLLKKITGYKIGLAFSEQLVEKIPKEEHDVPVDLIITDSLQIFNPFKYGISTNTEELGIACPK